MWDDLDCMDDVIKMFCTYNGVSWCQERPADFHQGAHAEAKHHLQVVIKPAYPCKTPKTAEMNTLPWQRPHTDTSVCPLGWTHADVLQHTKQCAHHDVTPCTQDTQQVTNTFSNLTNNIHTKERKTKQHACLNQAWQSRSAQGLKHFILTFFFFIRILLFFCSFPFLCPLLWLDSKFTEKLPYLPQGGLTWKK